MLYLTFIKPFIALCAAAIVATGAVLMVSGMSEDWRISKALGSYDCPPLTIELPYFGERSYDGPLIDTHMHIPHPPEQKLPLGALLPTDEPSLGRTVTVADYACMFSREGTMRAFVFFPVFPGFEELHTDVVTKTMETYPDAFVPFIMPPDDDGSPDGFPTVDADELEAMLALAPDVFRGYGEIGLYARGDHGGPTGAPALPPDSKRLKDIYPVLRDNKLLAYFHLGEGQQAAFERTLADNPDINFVFHGDQLVVYKNGGQDLSAIDEILSRHPNAYYGVDELYGDVWLLRPDESKERFLAHFDAYEDLLDKDVATWKAFIERHPDQVVWGTDRGVGTVWSMDADVGLILTRYARAFIARLDPSVQERFAYKNALRVSSK